MTSLRLSMRASIGESGIRVLPEMYKHRLLQASEETVNELQKIWREAGYEESECQRLLGDLLNKIKVVYNNEIASEKQILDHAKQEIENNIQELIEKNKQLGRETNVEYLSVMNCTDKLTELEKLLTEVTTEVSQRQKIMDAEMNVIMTLVNELGENPPSEAQFRGPPGTPHLSDVRLQLMKEFHKELDGLKAKRIEEIKTTAKDAFFHMCDLMYAEEGYNTMSDSQQFITLDKQIARYGRHSEFTFAIHKKDLAQLTFRLKRFIEEKEKRRNELAKTGEEIARLWTLLRVPAVEREQFQNSFKKNLSMETLSKGIDELNRLRDIRKSSIENIIRCIRNDILTLWEEAGIESEDNRRREFPAYFDDISNLEDSAVELHESYFNELRARVEELKPILLKISRRETVIQERVELEHLQMNPERLTARGPNAREERKREEAMTNRVKNLEKITKEIVAQISAWEETNGPFIYAGERYFDRISKQEEAYIEIRDTLRNSRKKKDGKTETSTLATTKPLPGKKATFAPPATPHTTIKGKTLTATNNAPLAVTPASAIQSAPVLPPAPPAADMENFAPMRNQSRDSEGTIYTSVTAVKDRSSTGSVTVVQESS